MLKRRPKFALLLTTFYLYTNSSPIIFEDIEYFSSLVKLPHSIEARLLLRGSLLVWQSMKLVYACNDMLVFLSRPSRLEKEEEEKEKEMREERNYIIHSLHSMPKIAKRFSIDLDFSLWTRVTLTFVYESIITTALNYIPASRFGFTISRNKRDIRDRERPLKIMLFIPGLNKRIVCSANYLNSLSFSFPEAIKISLTISKR